MFDRSWGLSAPEAEVVLRGPTTDDRRVIKLAIKELIIRKELRLAGELDGSNLLGRFSENHSPLGRPLQCILDLHASASARNPTVRLDTFVKEMFSKYRGKYVELEVLPALENRRIYRRVATRRLVFWTSISWILTPFGIAARMDLETSMVIGRGIFGGLSIESELLALAQQHGCDDRDFGAIDNGVEKGWRDWVSASHRLSPA